MSDFFSSQRRHYTWQQMQDAHNLFDFHVEEKFVQILFDFCPEENLPFLQDMVKFTEKELDI